MAEHGAGPARLDARRRDVQLSSKVSKKLTAYVASAVCRPSDILAAAAVGVVALAGQPAAADIILNTNPITMPYLYAITGTAVHSNVPWSFDGGVKFSFSNRVSNQIHGFSSRLSLQALSGNGFLAGPLAKGAVIGPGGAFIANSAMQWVSSYTSDVRRLFFSYGGLWRFESGYLGFEFTGSDGLEFGWANLTVDDYYPGGELVMSEFAYDTVPGQSIQAGQTTSTPEPGTLGLLALGSLGLAFWRRKREVPTSAK